MVFHSSLEGFDWGIQNITYQLLVINLILYPAAALGA